MFASNFSALENDLNTLPRKLGEDYPMMWCHIQEDKNPQEFPAVIRTSNAEKNAHSADGY
jgi:hypothetical protein